MLQTGANEAQIIEYFRWLRESGHSSICNWLSRLDPSPLLLLICHHTLTHATSRHVPFSCDKRSYIWLTRDINENCNLPLLLSPVSFWIRTAVDWAKSRWWTMLPAAAPLHMTARARWCYKRRSALATRHGSSSFCGTNPWNLFVSKFLLHASEYFWVGLRVRIEFLQIILTHIKLWQYL